MQKHNEMVDRIKNEWAAMHGYVLLRIWESDINNNAPDVMKELRRVLNRENNKNKRH